MAHGGASVPPVFFRHHMNVQPVLDRPHVAAAQGWRTALFGAISIACLSLLAAGCADDDLTATRLTTTAPSTTIAIPTDAEDLTGKAEVTVVVTDNQFTPRHMKISVGTKVTWVNKGENDHNVMSADGTTVPKMAFSKEQNVSFVFDKAEFIPYYCSVHGTPRRGQNGSIQVVA